MAVTRFFLRDAGVVLNACKFISALLVNSARPWVIEIKEMTRSLEQNAKMWCVLTDISKQVKWYGEWLSPEDWKHVITAVLRNQRSVPGINGGFVVLGLSTSKMSIREMSDVIEMAHAFGAEHGVKWGTKAMDGIRWSEEWRNAA